MATATTLRHDPATTLLRIVDVMYGEGPDQQWDAETIELVAQVLHAAGLVPTDDPEPESPNDPPLDSWTHRRVVCEHAIASLATVRVHLRNAGASRAREAVARAMKSVDGARRHARRFEQHSTDPSANPLT